MQSMDMPTALWQHKGRGAASNDSGRFEAEKRVAFDDGWGTSDEEPMPLRTTLSVDATRTIIARNDSPDIGFDRSINPIAAASTAASIATRGRATPSSDSRPASISRAASSTSRRRQSYSPPS